MVAIVAEKKKKEIKEGLIRRVSTILKEEIPAAEPKEEEIE